jgi:hypothetical protein
MNRIQEKNEWTLFAAYHKLMQQIKLEMQVMRASIEKSEKTR